jgi:hypothetical protein
MKKKEKQKERHRKATIGHQSTPQITNGTEDAEAVQMLLKLRSLQNIASPMSLALLINV